jgi:hypothetical protein
MLHVQLLKLLLILWYIHRQELVESLFTLLKCSQSGTWPSSASKSKMTEISGDEKEKSKTVNLDYVQQLILMALERVIALSHFQGGEQEVIAVSCPLLWKPVFIFCLVVRTRCCTFFV